MNHGVTLMVIAKSPQPGRVKTRLCPPCTLAEAASLAEAALAEGEQEIAAMCAALRANRDYCLAALRSMPGVTVPDPEGAFYLFPRVEGLKDSFGFCRRLLEETKVGIAPGVALPCVVTVTPKICLKVAVTE